MTKEEIWFKKPVVTKEEANKLVELLNSNNDWKKKFGTLGIKDNDTNYFVLDVVVKVQPSNKIPSEDKIIC